MYRAFRLREDGFVCRAAATTDGTATSVEQVELDALRFHGVDDVVGPEHDGAFMEARRELTDLLLRLPEPYRAVLLLRYFEGLAPAEVAEVAEDDGHHPDLHIEGYRNVTVELWTHAIAGLSENDFICAANVDHLVGD